MPDTIPVFDQIIIAPLSAENGGGYCAAVANRPGCMGDGDTPAAALADVLEAIAVWDDAAQVEGHANV